MSGAAILDGDYVTVDPRAPVGSGDIAVVVLHQPLLKRVVLDPDGSLWLRSECEGYPDLIVERPSWMDVVGKVVTITRLL